MNQDAKPEGVAPDTDDENVAPSTVPEGVAPNTDERDVTLDEPSLDITIAPGAPLRHKEGEVFHLSTDAETQPDSTLCIRWCACDTALQKLREKGASNLHMLLVIKPENEREERILRPLGDMMTYVQFHRPGKHTIYATIIWATGKDNLKSIIYGYDSCGSHSLRLMNYEGEMFDDHDLRYAASRTIDLAGREEMEITVDEQFFAKEPPAWLSALVNKGFSKKPVDQCSFRRRAILFFTVTGIGMLLLTLGIVLIRTIYAGILLLLGKKPFLKAIIRPYYHTIETMGRRSGKSIFKNRMWPFCPLIWVSLGATITILQYYVPGFCAAIGWGMLEFIILYTLAAFLAILLQVAISKIASAKFFNLGSWIENQKEWRKKQKEEARQAALDEEFRNYPSCPGIALDASLSALPRKKQTIWLRLGDIKRRVCKPYARRNG